MSEYRDDLEAAHRRIERLESELAAAKGARAQRGAGVVVGVIAVFVILLIFGGMGAGAFFFVKVRPPVTTVTTAVPPPALPMPGGKHLQWYPQSRDPLVTDVNADGRDDVVGLFWDASSRSEPLWVVALSHEGFGQVWHAGPYPAKWSSAKVGAVAVGKSIVVVDSKSLLHVLDASTGVRSRVWTAPQEVSSMCAPADGSTRLWLDHGFDQHYLFDIVSGSSGKYDARSFSAIPKSLACADSRPPFCGNPKVLPCNSFDAVRGKTPFESGVSVLAIETGDVIVSQGYVAAPADAGPTEGRTPYLTGADGKTRKLGWEGPVLVAGDRFEGGGIFKLEVHDGAIAFLYQRVEGPLRLGVRDAKSGALVWSVTVPDSGEASIVESMTIKNGRIYLVADDSLQVYDVSTGSLVTTVHAAEVTAY